MHTEKITYYHATDIAPADLDCLEARDNTFQGDTRYGLFFSDDISIAQKYGYYIYSFELDENVEIIEDETEVDSFYIQDDITEFQFERVSYDMRQELLHKIQAENLSCEDAEKYHQIIAQYY